MRVAVTADVHANLPAFEAVLADASRLDCARVYHAGDLIAIGPYPAEVVDLARARGVLCVQGNHEEWLTHGLPTDAVTPMQDEELMHQHWTHSRLDKSRRDSLRAQPHLIEETLDGVHIAIAHFALGPDRVSLRAVDFCASEEEILDLFADTPGSLICFGHLHGRRINREYRGRHYLNPGAVGCAQEPEASYAVVETDCGRFRIEERSVPYERRRLLERYDRLEIPARDSIRRAFFGVTVGAKKGSHKLST